MTGNEYNRKAQAERLAEIQAQISVLETEAEAIYESDPEHEIAQYFSPYKVGDVVYYRMDGCWFEIIQVHNSYCLSKGHDRWSIQGIKLKADGTHSKQNGARQWLKYHGWIENREMPALKISKKKSMEKAPELPTTNEHIQEMIRRD